MLKNILKITFRSFWKHKSFTLINVIGLSAGLATCILIFLFIQDELSYDQHHEHADRIYRLESRFQSQNGGSHWAATQGFLIPSMLDRYPAIEAGAKVMPVRQPVLFQYGERQFSEEHMVFADSTYFNIFSHRWIKGNPATALDGPQKVVITQSIAKKYFGEENPLGKTLKRDLTSYEVTGVIEDVPANSHFHFEFMAAMSDLKRRWPGVDQRGPSTFYSYVMLNEAKSLDGLKERLGSDFYEIAGFDFSPDSNNVPEGFTAELLFNNIRDIHLGGNAEKEWETNGEMQYIYIFATIAFFILIIASFNYMNLATARSAGRAREVGVRKVLGAFRKHLFFQFMGESLILTAFSMGLAIVVVNLVLPYFNDFTGKSMTSGVMNNPALLMGLTGIFIFIGSFSGLYPAVFLSGFKPLSVLKANQQGSGQKGASVWLRKGLVVLQFAISIFLIVGALTVYRQLNFIQDKNLGFNKEQVLVFPMGRAVAEKIEALETELNKETEVISSTPSSTLPGKRVHIMSVRVPILVQLGDDTEQEDGGGRGMRIISVDEEVIETFGFEIVAGRGFSKEYGTDARSGFLLNEAAVKEFGYEDPIGKPFEYTYNLDTPKVGTIVGIVKDFHYASLHSEVEPLMMHVWPSHHAYLNVRLKSNDMSQTLGRLEEIWASVLPSIPFDYFFLDDNYDRMYKAESSLGTLLTYFTLLAILIACLGLFGLASFMAQQRTREIGIRKVLGASIMDIVGMLSGNFAALVGIACVLGLPVAWWLMDAWLEDFAYRTELSLWLFAGAGVVALGIALLTVSYQSFKAALANPVDSLKDE